MARFLVDESLPRSLTRALQAAGHDATDARDVGLRGRPDEEVHAVAVREDRVIATGDTDFGNALRFPVGSHAGVMVLRVPETWTARQRVARFMEVLAEIELAHVAGSIVIVEPARTRVFTSPGDDA